MSHSLISHSPDLKRLESEGYEVEVRYGHLLLRHVPYVAETGSVKHGTLVSELTLAGETTARPSTHVVMFAGDMPCDTQGRPLAQIRHSSGHKELAKGLTVDHIFSSKPPDGYNDYYEKMTTYEGIISGPAQTIEPGATARTFAVVEAKEEDSVFKYIDTASSRAGISAITDKLRVGAVAIVGLGGTGSYILDLVAKDTGKGDPLVRWRQAWDSTTRSARQEHHPSKRLGLHLRRPAITETFTLRCGATLSPTDTWMSR